VHAVASIAEVDGGAVGDAPHSLGWSHNAARDWGEARRGMGRDGDGCDRVGPMNGASRARQADGAADADVPTASRKRGESCCCCREWGMFAAGR
jgi:hypothetical protein